ncbi:MAG: hypothetical protein HZC23_12965 [Rhodocyclales bacterium]|nr:hypothetical protein [Rhodocyclales bacterium]
MRRAYADSRLAVALRRLRSRFGISAPKVAVRTHIPWYWRALATIAVLSISMALAGWVYDAGRKIAGFDRRETEQEMTALRDRVAELELEAAKLRALTNAGESTMQIERTAQQQLISQVKALEQENGRLKEDLAFFENLAAAEGKEAGFTINRLRVEQNGNPGQYRYRLLAAAQGGKKDREFRGSVQLVISLHQDGKSAMMTLPVQNDPARHRFNINFKHFQRVDGTFQVPVGARVTSVEARLVQDGVTRASQTVTL